MAATASDGSPMEPWFVMLGVNLLMVGLMISIGIRLQRVPSMPRQGSLRAMYWGASASYYGYLSARSMKNADTWDFANRDYGRRVLRNGSVGAPVVVVAMAAMLATPGRGDAFNAVVGIGSMVLLLGLAAGALVPMVQTERTLKATFTADGTRRNRRDAHEPRPESDRPRSGARRPRGTT